MQSSRRRLPHFYAPGRPTFITFRLKDSLPAGRVFPTGPMTGAAFVCFDRMLDSAAVGPRWLNDERLASAFVEVLDRHSAPACAMHAWVVMPNHVHLLLTPQRPQVAAALGRIKGASARACNELLGREGPFWQDESFDRLVRTDDEFRRITSYILQNPVRAGLAERPEDYRWSSAWQRPNAQ